MNSITKPSFYFSAYPLKAVKEPPTNQKPSSPYLKALLSGKTRPGTNGRVLSMKSFVKGEYKPTNTRPVKTSRDIEPGEKDWFGNYE